MLKIVSVQDSSLTELFMRKQIKNEEIQAQVRSMVEEIRRDGWAACLRFSEHFDKFPPREIPKEEWQRAERDCAPNVLSSLRVAAENIRRYQTKILPKSERWRDAYGVELGQLVRPLSRIGIYVPGGTAAYPSSVLMTAVCARAAGVGEIIMATPPGEFLRTEVLAAAAVAGVDRFFAIGGVPAVAAMTYGLGCIPRCDKIVGPGNAYVQAAKRELFGDIGIDSLAGPSDICILADKTANPAWVAADLLSQAEHDKLSGSILVSTDKKLCECVQAELETQLQTLPRREIAEEALRNQGLIVLCETLAQAVDSVNQIASEHLEIILEDAEAVLPDIRNAGAIFLGPFTPEPLGDYWAGPSHVLPTGGTSRFSSALSSDTFVTKTSLINYSNAALRQCASQVVDLAKSESLVAHARSIEIRTERNFSDMRKCFSD